MRDVDVLIPCYNYARFLEAAVESALTPDGPSLRVLIIDDASTDDTPAVGARLVERYPDIVSFVRHEKNRGHHNTYNEGLQWIASRYFVMLSADDLFTPGSIRRAAAFLDAHPDVGMVYGGTRTFDKEAPALQDVTAGFATRTIDGQTFIRDASRHGYNPVSCPASVVVRSELQRAVGDYHPRLPHSGDLEMWLRFAARADVGFIDVDQSLYRRHTANMSLQYLQLRDFDQRLLAWQIFCADHGHRVAGHAQLLRNVEKALAAELFETAVTAFHAGAPIDVAAFARRAAELDPDLAQSPAFRKLTVKRMLGRTLTAAASRFISVVS